MGEGKEVVEVERQGSQAFPHHLYPQVSTTKRSVCFHSTSSTRQELVEVVVMGGDATRSQLGRKVCGPPNPTVNQGALPAGQTAVRLESRSFGLAA